MYLCMSSSHSVCGRFTERIKRRPPKRISSRTMQAPQPRKLIPRSGNAAVASGPTILIEDSIVFPSQTPGASQVPGRTPRVRTILSAEAEEEAIQLTSEGKITAKNAWNIKLLDGIHDSVSNALSNTAGQEDAAQFTKCANLVEGGAKIWTQRVEHTAARSHQVVRRLLRNDAAEEENENEDGNGEGGANGGERKAAKKQRKKERTVAERLDEINLDPNAKAQALMQSGTVSAQFRAITERFDQGHAQGLLLNNAPMGALGNLILDVDYAANELQAKPNTNAQKSAVSHASPSRPRLSTAQLAAEIGEVRSPSQPQACDALDDLDETVWSAEVDSVVLDPPNHRPSWGSLSDAAPVAPARGKGRSSARLSAPDDLMVPNMSQVPALKEEVPVHHEADGPSPGRGSQRSSPQGQGAVGGGTAVDDNDDNDDFGDYGGQDDDDYPQSQNRSESQSSQFYATSRAGSSVRDLVSGAADLAFFDSIIGASGEQLAVAAEDPNSWFPMSQADASAALSHAPTQWGSNLNKIRKETLLQQRAASQEVTQPTKKKIRADGGVVAIGDSIDDFIAPNDIVTLAANENKLMNARRENLKKATADMREYFTYKRSSDIARDHNILLPDVDSKGALPWWLPPQANDVASFFQPFACSSIGWNVLNKRVATADDAARLVHPLGRPSGPVAPDGAEDPIGDMPLRVFDDDEMGAGDFGDDGLMDDDDDGDAIAYAAGFDLPRGSLNMNDDGDHHDLGHFVSAADAAGRSGDGELDILVRPEMIRALESHHATVPTQVDVVRLRRIMWQQTQRVIKEEAPEMIMVATHGGADNSVKGKGRRFGKLKRGQPQGLKRSREDDSEGSNEDSGASDEDGQSLVSRHLQQQNEGDFTRVPMHRFSDVVAAMLPQIPTVSTTGSLSPAFFFFSLLFLANEHGILLDNVPGDVQDIYITGLLDEIQKQAPTQQHQVPVA